MLVLHNFFLFFFVFSTIANSLELNDVLSCEVDASKYRLTISEVSVPEVDCTELNFSEDSDVLSYTTSVTLTFQIERESDPRRRTNCTDSGSEYFFVDFDGQLQRKGACSNVQVPQLDENPYLIESVSPGVFQNMPDLLYLNFDGHNVDPSFLNDLDFPSLPSLEALRLRRNGLTSLNNISFTAMSNLIYLDLSRNEIEELPENGFLLPNRAEFQGINLSFNKLTMLRNNSFMMAYGPNDFISIEEGHLLSLEGNPLTRIESGSFSKVSSSIINLRDTELRRIEAGAISTSNQVLLNRSPLDCCQLPGIDRLYKEGLEVLEGFECTIGRSSIEMDSYTPSFDADCCSANEFFNYDSLSCEPCVQETNCLTKSDFCTKDLTYGSFKCFDCPNAHYLLPYNGTRVSIDEGQCKPCASQDECIIDNVESSCLDSNTVLELVNRVIDAPVLPCVSCKAGLYPLESGLCDKCTADVLGCVEHDTNECIASSSVLRCTQCLSGYELDSAGNCNLNNDEEASRKRINLIISIVVPIFVLGILLVCGIIYYIYRKKKRQDEKFGGFTPKEFVNMSNNKIDIQSDEQYQEVNAGGKLGGNLPLATLAAQKSYIALDLDRRESHKSVNETNSLVDYNNIDEYANEDIMAEAEYSFTEEEYNVVHDDEYNSVDETVDTSTASMDTSLNYVSLQEQS